MLWFRLCSYSAARRKNACAHHARILLRKESPRVAPRVSCPMIFHRSDYGTWEYELVFTTPNVSTGNCSGCSVSRGAFSCHRGKGRNLSLSNGNQMPIKGNPESSENPESGELVAVSAGSNLDRRGLHALRTALLEEGGNAPEPKRVRCWLLKTWRPPDACCR